MAASVKSKKKKVFFHFFHSYFFSLYFFDLVTAHEGVGLGDDYSVSYLGKNRV